MALPTAAAPAQIETGHSSSGAAQHLPAGPVGQLPGGPTAGATAARAAASAAQSAKQTTACRSKGLDCTCGVRWSVQPAANAQVGSGQEAKTTGALMFVSSTFIDFEPLSDFARPHNAIDSPLGIFVLFFLKNKKKHTHKTKNNKGTRTDRETERELIHLLPSLAVGQLQPLGEGNPLGRKPARRSIPATRDRVPQVSCASALAIM